MKQLRLVLGTGMCGMDAAVDVLNRQPGCQLTFNQMPVLPWVRAGRYPKQLENRLRRMESQATSDIYGESASSYLPYLEEIFANLPGARAVCFRLPRETVVREFVAWLKNNYPIPVDHWARTPIDGWTHDPVYSRAYPKYEPFSLEEGLRRYWDDYSEISENLARRFPNHFRILNPEVALNTTEGMVDFLEFMGVPREDQVILIGRFGIRPEPALPRSRPMAERPSSDPMDPKRCVVLVPYNTSIVAQCDEALKELERRGYPVRRVVGFAAIDQGRNQLAADALADGFWETLWIDADVGFHPDDVERIRRNNLPICSAIYPQKGKRALATHIMPNTKSLTFGVKGGLEEVLFAATGFLHVRREVYLNVMSCSDLPVCNERFAHPTIPFFQPMVYEIDDGTWYLAEDYAFSHRVRAAGYRIYADTRVRLWHYGTYAYGWEDAGREPERFESFTLNFGSSPSNSKQSPRPPVT